MINMEKEIKHPFLILDKEALDKMSFEDKQKLIVNIANSIGVDTEDIHDGYHSFYELYRFRMLYNALLFNEWAKTSSEANWLDRGERSIPIVYPKYNVHKSRRHYDGELCFGGGWFVVVAVLPGGQITNHYEEKYWHLFEIPAYERAMYPFDGHTSIDVATRMENLLVDQHEVVRGIKRKNGF